MSDYKTYEYKERSDGTIIIDQRGCARCGSEGHERIRFQRFLCPVVVPLGSTAPEFLEFTHWAICPTTGEPILMHVIKDEEDG